MYQHGKRTKQPHSVPVFIGTTMLMGVVLLIGWYFLHKDVGSSNDATKNAPLITEVGESEDKDKQQIIETLFSIDLPVDWKLKEKRSSPYANFYQWISTKKGADDRRLTLHIDIMPVSYKLVRMQPLISNGQKFLLGNLSNDCVNFAGGSNIGRNFQNTTPIDAKWENVSFICDPITINQTIGTGTPGGTIGTPLTGSQGRHTYFFFYEDHNIYPDDGILRNALSSFRAL